MIHLWISSPSTCHPTSPISASAVGSAVAARSAWTSCTGSVFSCGDRAGDSGDRAGDGSFVGGKPGKSLEDVEDVLIRRLL